VLEFNGISDNVLLPTISGGTPELTISVWINLSSFATINAMYEVLPFSPRGFRFYVFTDGSLRTGIEGNTPSITATAFTFNAGDFGTWFHVAAAYSNTSQTMKLYINGQKELSVNLTTTDDVKLGTARLGGQAGPPATWFEGMMDDVRIYSRTLSDSEIDTVYQITQ
jgi:hypothetical protein